MQGYSSGQRGQTVNLLASPSKVRILHPAPFITTLEHTFNYRSMTSTAAIAENIPSYQSKTVGIGRALDPHWITEATNSFNSNVGIQEALQVGRTPGLVYVRPEELAAIAGNIPPRSEAEAVSQISLLLGGIVMENATELPTLQETIALRLHQLRIREQKSFIVLQATFFDNHYEQYSPLHLAELERRIIRTELGLLVSKKAGSLTSTPLHRTELGGIRTKAHIKEKGRIRSRISADVDSRAKFGEVGALLF